MEIETMKVKPWGEEQGDHVIINKADFNPEVHTAFEEAPPAPTRAGLDAALEALPGTYTDPDFVVAGMKRHWGDLFTAADEAQVRDLVKAPAKRPSEGLKVDDLKEALKAKNIAIPDGAKKEDLAKLLDEAA